MSAVLSDVAIQAINHVVLFKILKCVFVTAPSPSYLQTKHQYWCGFLDQGSLMHYARSKEYDLSQEFLGPTLAKGDECFGILDGKNLASYGWYSNKATDALDGLMVHFDNKHIYMYKGFTHPKYRGQRLHAIGMTMALKEYLNRGFRGLVSTVEWNNFESLKSVYRMGYQDFGTICVIRILDRYLIHCTKGCRDFGFWLEEN